MQLCVFHAKNTYFPMRKFAIRVCTIKIYYKDYCEVVVVLIPNNSELSIRVAPGPTTQITSIHSHRPSLFPFSPLFTWSKGGTRVSGVVLRSINDTRDTRFDHCLSSPPDHLSGAGYCCCDCC